MDTDCWLSFMFVFCAPTEVAPCPRCLKNKGSKEEDMKQVKIETRKPPRIKSHDFKAWDKFDVVSQGVMQDFEVGGGGGIRWRAKHIAA